MTVKCKSCGSPHINWNYHHTTQGGVPQGKLTTRDIETTFILSCEVCDDIESIIPINDVCRMLVKLNS